jgi:hypothetical protein
MDITGEPSAAEYRPGIHAWVWTNGSWQAKGRVFDMEDLVYKPNGLQILPSAEGDSYLYIGTTGSGGYRVKIGTGSP